MPEARDLIHDLAEDVLFPAALTTDRAERVPVRMLDRLAEAGLYGMAGPPDAGGLALDIRAGTEAVEILAGACLSTTFVWVQHHGAVLATAYTAPAALRERWLAPLCRGEARAGVALAGLLPGPPQLRATPVADGWLIDGTSRWVTGWGLVDVVQMAARDADDNLVWLLADAVAARTLRVEPLAMVALNATGTVTLHFDGHHVPADRTIRTEPYALHAARDAAGLRLNGSLALGVARRCGGLLGPSPLDAEVDEARRLLDAGTPDTMPAARAAACELASRAASALVVAGGSRSILLDHHAQRLAREALFLLVFGSRPAIRAELSASLQAG